MKKNEALEWLRGERSMANIIPQEPFDTWQLRVTQADAAMVQQAFYIVNAYNMGMIEEDEKVVKE